MEKKRLFQILGRADRETVAAMSEKIQKDHSVMIIKDPGKTLAMIKMREPVRQSLFYLGEVIVCEAVVELDGKKGAAVTMGDDTEKTLHMAVIDAAMNHGVFQEMQQLLELEEQQQTRLKKENAMHLKTMVSFESMDREVPQDVGVRKKA